MGTLRVSRAVVSLFTLVLLLASALVAQARAETAPSAPANDELSAAQVIHSLPATLSGTTVGATVLAPVLVGGAEVGGEAMSLCGTGTTNSVWYSVRPSSAERIALDLAAAGALDATVDVYHAVRSQLIGIDCEKTDSHGKASLSFMASKNGLYDIRIAAQAGSQLDPFSLEVFLPTPAVVPPGRPLAPGGVAGQVDRIQNINAAYSFILHQGVSYLINLTNETRHGCVSGALFAPGSSSFEDSSLLGIHCGGYRLFTPGPGEGGRYSFEVRPRLSFAGVQHFHLQVGVAGRAETAPGLELGNYARARGRLDGNGVHVLRLYRLDETTHSSLTLKLSAPESADFNLQLRNQNGHVIACECAGSGSQTLQRELQPGRYYAVVSVRDRTAGNFTLLRESRTITSTSVSFSSSKAAPGQALAIQVAVKPAASGTATVDIERFDPVFGWQFYREDRVAVNAGSADDPFTAPAVGLWRAKASYGGSRTSSPSAVGHTYLLVS